VPPFKQGIFPLDQRIPSDEAEKLLTTLDGMGTILFDLRQLKVDIEWEGSSRTAFIFIMGRRNCNSCSDLLWLPLLFRPRILYGGTAIDENDR
jgi:hypothetical protein